LGGWGRGGPGAHEGGWPGDEVGWGLLQAAARKGLAYEGTTAAMDRAFDALGWERVIHCIAPGNLRSIALAERPRSRRERTGVALPAPMDSVVLDIYGRSRAQWRSRLACDGEG
jgi:RimJ/RimL family protein N-acetyltransferase